MIESSTKLNSMQLFMLQLFDRPISPTQEAEIKQLLADYFATQIDKEMEEIWAKKGFTSKRFGRSIISTSPYKILKDKAGG